MKSHSGIKELKDGFTATAEPMKFNSAQHTAKSTKTTNLIKEVLGIMGLRFGVDVGLHPAPYPDDKHPDLQVAAADDRDG